MSTNKRQVFPYSHVVLGGTFDHLHIGHRKLLERAFSLAPKVTIGLTTETMNVEKGHLASLQSFAERKQELMKWIQQNGNSRVFDIVKIHDVFGSTLNDTSLDAIVVTSQTLPGAEKINTRRQELGMKPLPIEECDLVKDKTGNIISSTRIRSGEISREGFLYTSIFDQDISLSDETRELLRKVHGEQLFTLPLSVLSTAELPYILVGDVIAHRAVNNRLSFSVAYIDAMSRKQAYAFDIPEGYGMEKLDIQNPAGTIAVSAAKHVIEHLAAKNTIFQIKGEEDLLAVVAVLVSPLGSHVAYGNEYGRDGISFITITEEIKSDFASALVPDSFPVPFNS